MRRRAFTRRPIAVLSFRTHARHVQACVQDIVESARELEEAS
jgi:hypothetical protein